MAGVWDALSAKSAGQRSGFYLNFISEAAAAVSAATLGTVASIITADWGPEGIGGSLTTEAEVLRLYSDSTGGTAKFCLTEILKNAATVIPYRILGANAAAASGVLANAAAGTFATVTAKYKGAYGNFTVVVEANPVAGFDVSITKGGVALEKVVGITTSASLVTAFADSNYVTVTAGTGTCKAQSVVMSGGVNGDAAVGSDYTAALAVLETIVNRFDVFHLAVSDSSILTSAAAWVRRLRNEGAYITAVFGGASGETHAEALVAAAAFNHEGIIYLYPGWTPAGEASARSGAECAAQIAGIVAGKGATASVTFAQVSGIGELNDVLTTNEIKACNAGGVLTVFNDGVKYKIEKGVNTRTSYEQGQSAAWSKIKVIRIFDVVAKSLTTTAQDSYVGKIDNDEDGQKTVLAAVTDFLNTCAKGKLIKDDYEAYADPDYAAENASGDSFYFKFGITPIDSMDKIFGTASVG